ncbi:MAG: hypothetical protein ACYC9X_08645 [Dehalococcoidia bacterium]
MPVDMSSQRRLLRCTVVLLCIAPAVAACRAGAPVRSDVPATPPTAAAPIQDPVASFEEIVAALNRQDAAGVYRGLSREARASLTSQDVIALVKQLVGADANFHIAVQSVNSRAVNGGQAQLGLTLMIDFQGHRLPLTEVAFLVLEDGHWRLSDHFLQTALAAAGRGAPAAAAPRVFRADGCVEGDVLAGVYLPSRLKVLDPCVTVEGVVRAVESSGAGEGDGDLSFDVEVAGPDLRLLNDVNRKDRHGWLHMEIVPLDQPRLPKPAVGEHVRVTGAWVTDTVHGHNEIHPVWALTVLPP